jgi:hypothetical protein
MTTVPSLAPAKTIDIRVHSEVKTSEKMATYGEKKKPEMILPSK